MQSTAGPAERISYYGIADLNFTKNGIPRLAVHYDVPLKQAFKNIKILKY